MKRLLLPAAILFFASSASALDRPVVLELFTSQGCPSCPEADALLTEIAKNPRFLPLSFHVTYFDDQGWKDPFASPANTKRQDWYVKTLKLESMFTPQMIIEGRYSVIGSDAQAASDTIVEALKDAPNFPITIAPTKAGDALDVSVGDAKHRTPPAGAMLYEVHFNRKVLTPIGAGSNGGMTVENANNVVAFLPIALSSRYHVALNGFAEDGIAYILQSPKGQILGAAYYMKAGR